MPWSVLAAGIGAAGSASQAHDSAPGPNYGAQLGYAAQKGYGKQTKDIRQGGKAAYQQYLAQMGMGDGNTPLFDVTQIPGYQQSLQQGLSAVNQGAAGAGMLMSGDRLKGLQSEGQKVFGNYYQDYMGRLQGLSQQRQDVISNKANLMSGFATNQSSYQANMYGAQQQPGSMTNQNQQNTMGYAGAGLGSLSDYMQGGGGGGLPGGDGSMQTGGMELNLSSIGL